MNGLDRAVLELVDERARAELRGDRTAVNRLDILVHLVELEAQYATGIAQGLPMIRRRADAPPAATVGWWWTHCAATRATRRVLGLTLPPMSTNGGHAHVEELAA